MLKKLNSIGTPCKFSCLIDPIWAQYKSYLETILKPKFQTKYLHHADTIKDNCDTLLVFLFSLEFGKLANTIKPYCDTLHFFLFYRPNSDTKGYNKNRILIV